VWKGWLAWSVATLLLVLYLSAGFIASRTDKVSIALQPGAAHDARVLRFAEDRVRMDLVFRGDHLRRPELGEWASSLPAASPDQLRFLKPGAAIQIAASQGGARVVYEAMPKTGHGADTVFRRLISDISQEPGVWRWPPATEGLALKPGTNTVRLEVVSVEAPLVGETVELTIHPALGFKSSMPNVSWLWWWFLWPILVPLQLLWAVILGVRTWRQARRLQPSLV